MKFYHYGQQSRAITHIMYNVDAHSIVTVWVTMKSQGYDYQHAITTQNLTFYLLNSLLLRNRVFTYFGVALVMSVKMNLLVVKARTR